jgi:hypothetical protein
MPTERRKDGHDDGHVKDEPQRLEVPSDLPAVVQKRGEKESELEKIEQVGPAGIWNFRPQDVLDIDPQSFRDDVAQAAEGNKQPENFFLARNLPVHCVQDGSCNKRRESGNQIDSQRKTGRIVSTLENQVIEDTDVQHEVKGKSMFDEWTGDGGSPLSLGYSVAAERQQKIKKRHFH